MRDLAVLFLSAGDGRPDSRPVGVRSVVAEAVLVGQQLLILNHSRSRSPNLRLSDRIVAGCVCGPHALGRLIRSGSS